MRVLSISTDRNICDPKSAVARRFLAHSAYCGHFDVIVFSLHTHQCIAGSIAENVHIHPTNSRSRWLYIFDAIRIARKLAKPDIVTVQDPFETGLVGVYLSKRRNVPLNVQVHTDLFAQGFVRSHILNIVRRAIAPFILRRASSIRSVSKRIDESLKKYIPKYILRYILPIYVDVERYKNSTRKKHEHFDPSFLIVSRLEPEKCVHVALEALAYVRAQGHKHAGLTIVGGGSERKRLEMLALTMGVADWVRFVGVADPLEHYAQASAVLFPSRYDGYGMVIVEALASGVPVISTDVGVAREAGAIVVSEGGSFANAALEWVRSGPRTAELQSYQYASEHEYVKAYCDALTSTRKKQYNTSL